ncbi:Bgt-1877 [Blumeria graminis f. sp. tritici]|uniref:Uncharacterized protein n=3 Tax=Blumeria graminis f. sp. tritici TaxID=62690 RepID=A0A656KPP8_BLUGR|nr:hypothetical protein BGT96224_1877 [Blumeria graminis f. sp. tritici 96224]VDB83992.1 Bgt-1877 [Blumeria graminis f. sp. tritici]
MFSLNTIDSVQIGAPGSTYVYDILPLTEGLAALSSDDALRILNPQSLSEPCTLLKNVGESTTCFRAFDTTCLIAVAGRDGFVRLWDIRSGHKQVGEIKADDSSAILSLAICQPFRLATGSELKNHQASVALWDLRTLGSPVLQYNESHSDDITELQFHPLCPNLILSGSTDGLINIYNSDITDEEEALHQTINHGASIHHANFITGTDIYALSHDENMSIYDLVTSLDESTSPMHQVHFNDVRKKLGGEYVAQVIGRQDGSAVLGMGIHSLESFELIQLKNNSPWAFMTDEKVTLLGGHGSDIIRSFCFLDSHQTVFTCGEDGHIKAWKGE